METCTVFGTTLYRLSDGWAGEEYMGRVVGSKNKPKENTLTDEASKISPPNKPKPAKAKSTQAVQLSEALAFVAVAGTKDDAPYKSHVILNNGFAVMSDGQLTAGFPIVESLECCPQLSLLASTITKCGASLSIAEIESGNLSVKGDKLKAIVPCIPFSAMPDAAILAPDPSIAAIDDRIKAAFNVCGSIVSEAGQRFFEAALLLEAYICTATNGKVLMQYQHGIDLPPGLVIPKIFAAAVCRIKSPLKGFGFKPDCSITFYFENGGWLKTLLYNDKYPIETVNKIMDKPSKCIAVPPGLFDAIATVSEFNDDGFAILENGFVCSHEQGAEAGAQYELDNLESELCLANQYAKMIAPFVTEIDLTTYPDQAYFFGENMRGVIVGIRREEETKLSEPRAQGESQSWPAVQTMDQWRAAGSNPNTIPF